MPTKTRNNRRKGANLVESGLVLMAMLLMLLGILDFAQFLFFHQVFSDRARAGARWAAVHTYDEPTVKNIVLYNSPAAPPSQPGIQAIGLFGLKPENVGVARLNANGDGDAIQVTISNFQMFLLSPMLSKNFTHRPFKVSRPVASLGASN